MNNSIAILPNLFTELHALQIHFKHRLSQTEVSSFSQTNVTNFIPNQVVMNHRNTPLSTISNIAILSNLVTKLHA